MGVTSTIFGNGRDDMAKKRSKRASKTLAARRKRKGKMGAPAPARPRLRGVIKVREQDPAAGAQPSGGKVIQSPPPDWGDHPLPTGIAPPASAPEAKPHPPGTAEFRYWT